MPGPRASRRVCPAPPGTMRQGGARENGSSGGLSAPSNSHPSLLREETSHALTPPPSGQRVGDGRRVPWAEGPRALAPPAAGEGGSCRTQSRGHGRGCGRPPASTRRTRRIRRRVLGRQQRQFQPQQGAQRQVRLRRLSCPGQQHGEEHWGGRGQRRAGGVAEAVAERGHVGPGQPGPLVRRAGHRRAAAPAAAAAAPRGSGSGCLLYTSPSPRDQRGSRMPSSA